MAIPFLSDIKLNGNQIKELVVDHKSGANPSTGYHGQLIFRTDENKIYINTSTTPASPSWSSIAGDITGVTAGTGLSGGGTVGDLTINIDISEYSAVTPASGDSFLTLDSDGSTHQRTTVDALATLFAGGGGGFGIDTGLSASSGVLTVNVDDTTIQRSGNNVAAKTATIADGGTGLATADQIHTFVTTQTDTIAADTSGTAAKVTVTDSTADTSFPVVFNNESDGLLDDTGAFTYNPSSGTLSVPNLTVSGSTTTVNTETILLADNIIVLNSNATGSASEDAGIEVERGDDANVKLQWNETNDDWEFEAYDHAVTPALQTYGIPRSYKTTVGGATSATVTHNLGTRDVIVQLYDTSSYDTVYADVVRTDTNTVTLSFGTAPSAGDVTVLVMTVG